MKTALSITSLCLVCALAFAGAHAFATQQGTPPVTRSVTGLSLEVFPDKRECLPGELVTLRIKVTNRSDENISLGVGASVYDGSMSVLVAGDGGEFKQYVGPGWGTLDVLSEERLMKPSDSFETEATLLWNQRIETAHLSADAAQQLVRGQITSDYVFPDPGVYLIKAVLRDAGSKSSVESDPVRVHVNAPTGEDSEVWNAIKGNGKLGYFIQSGGLDEHPLSEGTRRVSKELEQIVSSHPSSRYSAHIQRALAKHKERLGRLRANANTRN